MLPIVILLLSLSSVVIPAQPSAPQPVEAPLRELTFGQLNFLHTTDVHGWHAGHLQESSYSADWGDYFSFVQRMREKADANGQDLLVIDTGDRIEGNGLADASEPKDIYTFELVKELPFDLICAGNHELYKQNSSNNEYNILAPHFQDHYLASNLDIHDPETGEVKPLSARFKKFVTKNQAIKIMAFGFMFDFYGNSNNTIVQPVEETVEEQWFQDVIRDRDIDLFLVVGHVPVYSPEYNTIFKAIRSVQWDTPIQFFGGHTHIRDYKRYDSSSYGLESGRFMETIGFQSIDGIPIKNNGFSTEKSMFFFRRYIDNNLFSFYHHSDLNSSTFPTEQGLNISASIKTARKALHLDSTYGCATQDLWMNRAKYPSNESIFTWLEDKVLPEIVEDKSRANVSRLAIMNTGGIRFDIFKGPFTRDSTYIVSPFTSGFRVIRDVPYDKAKKLLALLNSNGQIFENADPKLKASLLAPIMQEYIHSQEVRSEQTTHWPSQQEILGSKYKTPLIPGYTTFDDTGSDGDDTIHSPISYYNVPNCIQAEILPGNSTQLPDTIDVTYIEFIQPWILLAFKFLGLDYSSADTHAYMEGENLTTLLADWVSKNWKDNC